MAHAIHRRLSIFLVSSIMLTIGSFLFLASCQDSRSPILKDLKSKQYAEFQEFRQDLNLQIDSLFMSLSSLEGRREINRVSARINYLWMQSGIQQVNSMMKLGVEAMELENYEVALMAFNEVIKVMPDYSEAWNKRATVWYAIGKYDYALSDIERTLQLEKRHFGALSGKANVYIRLKEYENAREALYQLRNFFPNFPELNRRIDEINEKMGVKIA
jgi:tetratricopeptide (TPR) repeat protein